MSAIIEALKSVLDFLKMAANFVVTLIKSFFQFLELMSTWQGTLGSILAYTPAIIVSGIMVVVSIYIIKTILTMGGHSR